MVDEGEFPGEVEGVLDADVEPLAAGGAVDVGGVAAKECRADGEVRDDAAVDGE